MAATLLINNLAGVPVPDLYELPVNIAQEFFRLQREAERFKRQIADERQKDKQKQGPEPPVMNSASIIPQAPKPY